MSRPPPPMPRSCNGPRGDAHTALKERFRRPLATVTRPRHRLRWSDHGSGDCPTTAWYRVSSGMLKLPPAARTDACRVSDAKSSWTLAVAADYARGSAVTVTTSAEVVGSSIRRLSHHRMMSGSVCDGCKLVCRSYYGRYSRIRSFERSHRGVEM